MPFQPGNPYGKRWVKGQTGNPGGRSGVANDLRRLFRGDVHEAREIVLRFMRDERAEVKTRVECAKLVLSYGLGAPQRFDPLEDTPGGEAVKELTVEELREIARLRLSTERPDDAVPEPDDGAVN